MRAKILSVALLLCVSAAAQNTDATGSAEVLSTAGRTSCEWVQLWEGGPKWATFNVGATITDYADLQEGADATPYYNYATKATYYNTANVGGLYAWAQPNYNGRQTIWTKSVEVGTADVATALWGSNWTTPTYEDLDKLCNSTYTQWTWCDGSSTQYVAGCTLAGCKVSGKGAYADKSIFLPCTGDFSPNNGKIYGASYEGYYWTNKAGWLMGNLQSKYSHSMSKNSEYYGYSLRAVLAEETSDVVVDITQTTGSAEVLSESGRTSCDYVQLWAGGPKWATFNVGATITDYANLTVGADAIQFNDYYSEAPYYNTANVGGLYAWQQPMYNGRETAWDESDVLTGSADVATALWGSNWKTPTPDQLDTLQTSYYYGKTTWTWCDGSTTQYVEGCTLKGYKVSGVDEFADNSIFLPAAGYLHYKYGVSNASLNGGYYSYVFYGYSNRLTFSSSGVNMSSSNNYTDGYSVRAVLVETANPSTGNVTQKDVKTPLATKIIRDGQLLIQRDGRNYTVHGVEVNL